MTQYKRKSTNRHKDGEDDIICRIKINPPTFNSILDPKNFSDWMADLNYSFNLYRFN